MRRIITFALVAASLSLASCGTTLAEVRPVAGNPPTPTVEQTATVGTSGALAGSVVLRGTQGLLVAHNAYQGAAAIATAYVRTGMASPAQLHRIRELNNRALYLLEQGGGGLSVAQRAAEVFNIVAELNLFGGRRN